MKKLVTALLIGAFALTAFQGCKAKKEIIKTETTTKEEKDSSNVKVEKVKEETKTPAIKETIEVKQPCDEKTGKVKPFHYLYNTGRGRVEVYTDSLGNIQVKIDLPEVKESRESDNRSETHTKEKAEKKEVAGKEVIEIIPFRYWLYLVGLGLASLLFLFLWLRRVFRN